MHIHFGFMRKLKNYCSYAYDMNCVRYCKINVPKIYNLTYFLLRGLKIKPENLKGKNHFGDLVQA